MILPITVFTDRQVTEFNKTLGYNLYMVSVNFAPYDTGNLAHSIRLNINTKKRIQIKYPIEHVHYLHYVEARQNFIKGQTVPTHVALIAQYFEAGNDLWLGAGKFNKRAFLASVAKKKGYGKGKVAIGRSRYNKDIRITRRERSNRLYLQSQEGRGS